MCQAMSIRRGGRDAKALCRADAVIVGTDPAASFEVYEPARAEEDQMMLAAEPILDPLIAVGDDAAIGAGVTLEKCIMKDRRHLGLAPDAAGERDDFFQRQHGGALIAADGAGGAVAPRGEPLP